MERHEIETFLALAQELHFRRTAERLHISSGRVSQTIAKLERRIGSALFERTSRHVQLTEVGRRLYDDIAPHHRAIQEAVARATAAARDASHILRVGFLGPATGAVLFRVISTYRDRHPGCEVQVVLEASLSDHVAALREGMVDVLATMLPIEEPDLVVGPSLLREGRILAVPTGHPFARRDQITLEDLAGETAIYAASPAPAYWQEFHHPTRTPSGRPIHRGPDVDTVQAGLTIIGAGQGIALATAQAGQYFQRPDITYVPVIDGAPAEFVLVWAAEGESAHVRAFAAAARMVTPSVT
ncbi:LysR family transcriptional regulator [Micromonospora polyrhachis]|uniref:DNA-binding transcriptional LysR family regulator n=1 Tax=Micromonospora polyrhachis TaxID=1282883 RepID=A0A7W7SWX7_9ACTN|nr:LysR family transcriptional regulator [Micromonospora polyrhachis]MBB4962488.1 DNA-binding transcriptional LysR family regulator [Micromonospora polyrhachis]